MRRYRPIVIDRIERLRHAGVSIWLNVLSRDLLESGDFAMLVCDRGVSGVTSNPTIFANAITPASNCCVASTPTRHGSRS
jgi:transaldolase